MKRKLPILFLILSISIFSPVFAITKTDMKNNIKTFFETSESRVAREKEEKAKRQYDEYFSEIENKIKAWEEYKDADTNRLQSEYQKYLNNKNNMEQNRTICDMLEQWEKEYNIILKNIDKEYKQAYDKMLGREVSNDEFKNFKKENSNLEGFKFELIVEEKLKNIQKIHEEIRNYSYVYEQKKVANFMATHKRKVLCGQIANLVYMPAAGTPEKGGLYSYNLRSSFPLKVVQVLPNGILVTGDYSIGYASTIKQVYIETNKKFVSNQMLRDYGMYEYVGIMHYKAVLGVQNAVWKFRQLSNEEIKKNFNIGNSLYFYQQY